MVTAGDLLLKSHADLVRDGVEIAARELIRRQNAAFFVAIDMHMLN